MSKICRREKWHEMDLFFLVGRSDAMNGLHTAFSAPRKCGETVILVIEDDPCTGEFLVEYLQEDRHYRVLLATNGRAALQMVQHIQPHLLMIDLLLPDMQGLEVCKQLLTGRDLETVPVLMLSAGASSEGVHQRHLSFLRKPFTLEEWDAFLDCLCPCTYSN
jgi:DNA-binding response OmpR family regulator